jgi:hypothetical protein
LIYGSVEPFLSESFFFRRMKVRGTREKDCKESSRS